MASRRCTTCGSDVSPFADRCPRCGADPEVALVELGGRERTGPAPPSSGSAGWSGRRGRRWLPVALAVAAVWAALVGIDALTGDDSGGDAAEDADAATTTTTQPGREPQESPATDPEAALPAPPVLGEPAGLHLVVDSPDGVLDIDLDAGTITEHGMAGQPVDANEWGVLSIAADGARWSAFPLETAERVVVEDGVEAWLLDDRPAAWVSRRGRLDLLDFSAGVTVEATVPLPPLAFVMGATGDVLVLGGAGRVFVIEPDGAVQDLGPGTALAADHGLLLLDRCDEHLQCGRVVVDVDTGAEAPIPALLVLQRRAPWIGPGSRVVFATLGPGAGGAVITMSPSEPGERELFADLAAEVARVAFSPDGRWVAAGGRGTVAVGTADGSRDVELDLGSDGIANGMIVLVDPVA